MDKDISIPANYNQSSAIIPIDIDAYQEFILSLLGQHESVEGAVEGAFEIGMGDFKHLNQIIDTRIDSQNSSSLLEFRAKLFFNDDSSILFKTIESFLEYKELRPLICDNFVFTWTYLVKFNNKKSSEKQEISIASQKGENFNRKRRTIRSRIISMFDDEKSRSINKISYSVRCTNREWGIEIATIIQNFLSSSNKVRSSFLTSLRHKVIASFDLIELLFMTLGLVFMLFFISHLTEINLTVCRQLSSSIGENIKDSIDINQKINFIIKIVSACSKGTESTSSPFLFILPLISALLFGVIIPALTYKLIQLPNYFFLLFTEESKKAREVYFRNVKNRQVFWWITIFAGIVTGTFSGVMGNFIYPLMIKFFTGG
jgi:hypothetical protein